MNSFEAERRFVERMKRCYPTGTRIELEHMDDPQAIPPGTRGTVQMVDDAGQLVMSWDNGRDLSLVPGEDQFHRLSEEELLAEIEEQNECQDFSLEMK